MKGMFLLTGVALTGLGIGMYLSANVGAGPRDSLMLALKKRSSWPIGKLRTSMEVTAMIVGWILGGPIGLGTVVASLLLGPVIQRSLGLFEILEGYGSFSKLIQVPIRKEVSN